MAWITLLTKRSQLGSQYRCLHILWRLAHISTDTKQESLVHSSIFNYSEYSTLLVMTNQTKILLFGATG